MDKQKIVTWALSTVVVVLVVAVVIYAQVVWQTYQEYQSVPKADMATTSEEEMAAEEIPELTPEENVEVLDSLYVPTEEEFSLEEQEAILNSLSTTSAPILPNEI